MDEQAETSGGGSRADRRWVEEAALAIDPLLADLWVAAWSLTDAEGRFRPDGLGTLLRMAYLQGYGDALAEPDRGALFRRLGVGVPPVKARKQPEPRSRRARGSSGSSDR
jgi:hypothetical protein